MATLKVAEMSWAEKIQAMEDLWQSLRQDADRLESPAWHARVLAETRENYAAGRERPVDWDVAKRGLKKPRE